MAIIHNLTQAELRCDVTERNIGNTYYILDLFIHSQAKVLHVLNNFLLTFFHLIYLFD